MLFVTPNSSSSHSFASKSNTAVFVEHSKKTIILLPIATAPLNLSSNARGSGELSWEKLFLEQKNTSQVRAAPPNVHSLLLTATNRWRFLSSIMSGIRIGGMVISFDGSEDGVGFCHVVCCFEVIKLAFEVIIIK